jgi:hypothetical protein
MICENFVVSLARNTTSCKYAAALSTHAAVESLPLRLGKIWQSILFAYVHDAPAYHHEPTSRPEAIGNEWLCQAINYTLILITICRHPREPPLSACPGDART